MSASQPSFDEIAIEQILKSQLPTSRVKRICKLDPEVNMINTDATKMLTKATELFIGALAKAAHTQAVLDKRRTVQPKDISRVIETNWTFEFLEDALDGWPEMHPAHKKPSGKENMDTVNEEDEPVEADSVLEEESAVETGEETAEEETADEDAIVDDDEEAERQEENNQEEEELPETLPPTVRVSAVDSDDEEEEEEEREQEAASPVEEQEMEEGDE